VGKEGRKEKGGMGVGRTGQERLSQLRGKGQSQAWGRHLLPFHGASWEYLIEFRGSVIGNGT
jgi:hypothetical protein